MKVGDKVKTFNIRDKTIKNDIYEIIEILGDSIKVKHNTIAGHFVFLKKSVAEIINEN